MSIYEKLYDWQKSIVNEFRWRENFGLFLDMGLGKTPISLAFAEINQCDKIIVVTINSKAMETENDSGSWSWWAKQSSINYTIKHKRDSEFDINTPEIFIINYESLFERGARKTQKVTVKSTIENFIKSCKNHNVAIIIDESHKLKDLYSQQTMAIQKIKKELKQCAKRVYTYLLTGTPFTSGYIDLYSQLKTLECPINKGEFVDTYCVRGQLPGLLGWQQPIVGYKNCNSLFDLVHKYAITIKSKEVINLPDQITINHTSQISRFFRAFSCEKMKGEEILSICNKLGICAEKSKNFIGKGNINNPFFRNIAYPGEKWIADTPGNNWLRARQLSIGFQGNVEECKWYDRTRLEQLEKFLRENEDNYLLFYNFTPELIEIYDICEKLGYNIDVYSGEVKSLIFYEKYCKMSDEQKLTSKKNIILANFASGSTGMNWQEYNKCIIFSCPLYKDYEQGIKRINRIGQKHTTIYHVFYQNNWLDKGMNEALQKGIDYNINMFNSDLKRVQNLLN